MGAVVYLIMLHRLRVEGMVIAFARGAEEQMYLQITRKSNYRRDKILMADRSSDRSIATARLLLDGCAFAKIDD